MEHTYQTTATLLLPAPTTQRASPRSLHAGMRRWLSTSRRARGTPGHRGTCCASWRARCCAVGGARGCRLMNKWCLLSQQHRLRQQCQTKRCCVRVTAAAKLLCNDGHVGPQLVMGAKRNGKGLTHALVPDDGHRSFRFLLAEQLSHLADPWVWHVHNGQSQAIVAPLLVHHLLRHDAELLLLVLVDDTSALDERIRGLAAAHVGHPIFPALGLHKGSAKVDSVCALLVAPHVAQPNVAERIVEVLCGASQVAPGQ